VNVRHPDGMTTSDGVVTDENGVDGLVLNLVATISVRQFISHIFTLNHL